MNQRVKSHFQKADPILFGVLQKIEKKDELVPRKSDDYFSDICQAIINQQLSDKAGATIFKRFVHLFPHGKVTPQSLMRLSDTQIRAVGPSGSKVQFLKSLARSVIAKEIVFTALETLSDEDVRKELVKLKGIGPWTAEMFLMFSLGREDVFSYGDLGLRRAIQKLYNFKKEPTKRQMEKVTNRWMPYRTYACRILWRSLEI
ncbi:hypothetical protein A2Z00_00330 [Candidatus Gottesmanbacteria bacterium RBG_13_45_10]|uniref:DNA-3-methyladenine glycosylase II n=1 Tax=Candidatus Gottesmanbacteria bacterium RBG_13_45_10 TaxID=1798370 RepID=A0A1F5ZHU2_9BACT|nr:MAG: hypothetical protein A2Z00_00330 [Candidatus Gottesmanbacteria bacterium RBG_13_45_10]